MIAEKALCKIGKNRKKAMMGKGMGDAGRAVRRAEGAGNRAQGEGRKAVLRDEGTGHEAEG